MKPTVKYFAEDNTAYIYLSQQAVLESEEVAPGIVFDFDQQGRLVGIELLAARAQLSPDLLADAT